MHREQPPGFKRLRHTTGAQNASRFWP